MLEYSSLASCHIDIQYGIITFIIILLGYLSCYFSPVVTKWTSTICGIVRFIWIFQNGPVVHFFLAVFVILFIILKVEKSKRHIISLFMTMVYFTWFKNTYYNHAHFVYYVDMSIMAIILKLIGLGFESHNSYMDQKEGKSTTQGIVDPTFVEAFHYVFGIVGNSAGQYIRYRTFSDAYRLPYQNRIEMGNNEFFLGLFQFLLILIIQRPMETLKYNYNIHNEDALMVFIQLFVFGFRTFISIYFSFLFNYLTTLGFKVGAYPVECCSMSGHGPTVKYDQVEELCLKKDVKYDFNTISFNDAKSNLIPYFKDSIKSWNKTVQYFLFKYIYTPLFPTESKEYRIFFTGFFSALWHGTELGSHLSLFFLWPTFSIYIDPLIKNITSSKGGFSKAVHIGIIIIKLFTWIFSFVFVSSSYIETHFNISDNVAYLFVLSISCMYLLEAMKKGFGPRTEITQS